MSEQDEKVQADADANIAEQTPPVGTITLRPTPDGYRVNLTKAQIRAMHAVTVTANTIASHATDGTEEPAERCRNALAELLIAYGTEA